MNWQEQWELHSEAERLEYSKMDTDKLLELIHRKLWGSYYRIWYALAEKTDAKRGIPLLIKCLKSDSDFLYRYHAAAALLKITGITGYEPVDLGGTHSDVKGNIARLEAILEAGPR